MDYRLASEGRGASTVEVTELEALKQMEARLEKVLCTTDLWRKVIYAVICVCHM